MKPVGVISNPRSQRNRTELPAVRAVVSGRRDVHHVELEGIGDVGEALREFARREVQVVAVNGGDGTVQAVMTELLNGNAFAQPPLLAVVPSGMTNVIAADVGLRGRPNASLARLLSGIAGNNGLGERLQRRVLTVSASRQRPPIHGMFLGTAAFYRGVLLAREKVHSLGVERTLAAGLGVALAVLRVMVTRRGYDALFRGDRFALGYNGQPGVKRDYILFMATTLERLFLGLRPFWGSGRGGVRYTSVEFPPGRPIRALLPFVRGRPRPWMEDSGYRSGRADQVALSLSCPIVFDGEMIMPEPDEPVLIRADHCLTFWQL